MMETETLVRLLGAFTGFLSLSLAIYFQMVMERRCPKKYIVGFGVAGMILLMLNIEAFGVERTSALTLEVLFYLFIIGIELYGGYKINKRLRCSDEEFLPRWLRST